MVSRNQAINWNCNHSLWSSFGWSSRLIIVIKLFCGPANAFWSLFWRRYLEFLEACLCFLYAYRAKGIRQNQKVICLFIYLDKLNIKFKSHTIVSLQWHLATAKWKLLNHPLILFILNTRTMKSFKKKKSGWTRPERPRTLSIHFFIWENQILRNIQWMNQNYTSNSGRTPLC